MDAVRRRVRPPRAVRHPGAVGVDVRRGAADARRARDGTSGVAAVPRRRGVEGCDHRTPGAPDPQQLRRQAVDGRPPRRQAPRRTRRPGPVGQHGGHRLHRSRPLSRRCAGRRSPRRRCSRHLGQAGDPAVRAARPHPADDPLARRAASPGRRARRPTSTSTPRSPTRSASSRRTAPTAVRSCRC